MRSRAATLVVLALVLMHQVVGGVFGGGTVLCVSQAGGIALQPAGLTCCPTHAGVAGAQQADACCPDDAPVPGSAVSAADCHGCVDHDLTMPPTLVPMPASLPAASAALDLVAIIDWPTIARMRPCLAQRWTPDPPRPAAVMLATVVLRT